MLELARVRLAQCAPERLRELPVRGLGDEPVAPRGDPDDPLERMAAALTLFDVAHESDQLVAIPRCECPLHPQHARRIAVCDALARRAGLLVRALRCRLPGPTALA